MYYIVVCSTTEPRQKRSALFRNGHICLASKPYQDGRFEDLEIHDARWKASFKARLDHPCEDVPADVAGGGSARKLTSGMPGTALQVTGNDILINFPQDYAGGEVAAAGIFEQVTRHLAQVARLTLPKLHPYDGSRVGYNIYGVDVLVTNENQAYLVEINGNPGYSKLGTAPRRTIAKWMFGGVQEFVLEYNAGTAFRYVTPLYTLDM